MNEYGLALVSFIIGFVIGGCCLSLYWIMRMQKEENDKFPPEERDKPEREQPQLPIDEVGYY